MQRASGSPAYIEAFIAAAEPSKVATIVRREISALRVGERDYDVRHRRSAEIVARAGYALEIIERVVLPSDVALARRLLPTTTEFAAKAQLVARHPHLLSANRVTWALRYRAVTGLSAAVFGSPCGELLIHEPSFLVWFLGLSGRAKPRAGRRAGSRLRGSMGIENNRGGPC